MRKLVLLLAVPTIACLSAPGIASAEVGWRAGAVNFGITEPVVAVGSPTLVPPGFSTDARQAEAVAKANPEMQALHAREHPLLIQPMVWAGMRWSLNFYYRNHKVAEVDVSPAGKLEHVWTGPLAIADYTRGNYSPVFDHVWVVLPFSLAFLLVFVDPRRLRRLAHLDALVLMSLLVSYWLFDHTHLEAAVWAVYPPLLYLLARMLWLGVRGPGRGGRGRLAPLLPTPALAIGLLALVGGRVALDLTSHIVTDVGYASVIGAHRIAHGLPIYWNGAQHGDTYGPITYLAYLPFELMFPWHRTLDYAAAGNAASLGALTFDLVTIAALIRLGIQLRGGAQGRRLGLALAWAWAACPFTLLGLMMRTNDGLVVMLTVLALVAFTSPGLRGALLGLAGAAKFTPAALLPLLASPRDRGFRATLITVGSFLVVVVLAIGLYLPPGGLREFYDHTLGFQLSRGDVFSPWALHPGLAPVKDALEVAALALAAAVAFIPRQRSLTQVCALAAAVTIAVQLPAIHWFYYYVIWFAPLMAAALLTPMAARETQPVPSPERIRVTAAPDAELVVA